jgi:hypothetical protein
MGALQQLMTETGNNRLVIRYEKVTGQASSNVLEDAAGSA